MMTKKGVRLLRDVEQAGRAKLPRAAGRCVRRLQVAGGRMEQGKGGERNREQDRGRGGIRIGGA